MAKAVIDKVTDWAARLAGARSGIQQVRDADLELRRAHAEAENERQRLIMLRSPKVEVLKMLEAEIPRLGAEWSTAAGGQLISALGGQVDVDVSGEIKGIVRYAQLADAIGALSLPALCALAPELVQKGMAAVITAQNYEEGPPMSERIRLLAGVDQKIASIEEQHAALVDEAATFEPPITIALLPAVAVRRRLAANEAERAEHAARDRAWSERVRS